MDHCIDCGSKVSRGRVNYHSQHAKLCLVCQVKRDMATFRYQSRAARLYALGKQQEAACTTLNTSES